MPKQLESDISKIEDQITLGLDNSLSKIKGKLGSSGPNVGVQVQADIKAARRTFSDDAANLYAKVDELAGGPIVPTAAIKEQAARIAAQLPKTAEGKPIFTASGEANPIADIAQLPDHITVQQAQRIRTMLREDSQITDLTPGIDKRDLGLLKDSVDSAFTNASRGPFAGSKDAIEALRRADAFYKEGIGKFDYPEINAIVRDARRGGAVSPERIVDYIIKPGREAAIDRVKALVPAETWAQVRATHFDNMLSKATSVTGGGEQVTGKALLDQIRSLGPTFNSVYGGDGLLIKKYAQEMAARDGKIDPSVLTGNVAMNIKRSMDAQKRLDAFQSQNFLKELGKPGQEATQAADFIFRPNSPQRIKTARDFYGESSPEFQGVQAHAMEKILGSIVKRGDDPLVKVFDGHALRGTLDQYGKDTLEETFGKELTRVLYKFSDVAELVTKKGPLGAGGLVAAGVAMRPLSHLGSIAEFLVLGKLLRSPGAIRWMVEGVSPNTPPKQAAAAMAKVTALATGIANDETGSSSIRLTAPERPEQP